MMSSRPPSTITSASPSFWQVMPLAPAAACILARIGLLCVLICGRLATPAASHSFCTRAMLRSTRSRSMTTAGVPNSLAISAFSVSMLMSLACPLGRASPRQLKDLFDVVRRLDRARVDLHRVVAERAAGDLIEVVALDADRAQRGGLIEARHQLAHEIAGRARGHPHRLRQGLLALGID